MAKLNITLTNKRGNQRTLSSDDYIDIDLVAAGRRVRALTFRHIAGDVSLVDENENDLIAKCAYCGEDMNTIIRAHHHTENGEDVTQKQQGKQQTG